MNACGYLKKVKSSELHTVGITKKLALNVHALLVSVIVIGDDGMDY